MGDPGGEGKRKEGKTEKTLNTAYWPNLFLFFSLLLSESLILVVSWSSWLFCNTSLLLGDVLHLGLRLGLPNALEMHHYFRFSQPSMQWRIPLILEQGMELEEIWPQAFGKYERILQPITNQIFCRVRCLVVLSATEGLREHLGKVCKPHRWFKGWEMYRQVSLQRDRMCFNSVPRFFLLRL